jgi:signal transduction histidine kinase/ActR/RegA family two-component response regulator
MVDLLSTEHRILERGLMQFRPFGVEATGERIRDTPGIKVRAFVDHLEESVARTHGREAGEEAVRALCRLLNERITDRAYHVSPRFLKNDWNSYSYEFVCFLIEFCRDISGDPLFAEHAARAKFISSLLQTLGRPFSVRHIYEKFAYFGEKLSSLTLGVESITDRSAVLTLRYPQAILDKLGPYRSACAVVICQSAKGGLAAIPEKVHHLRPAVVRDLQCVAHGDDCCRWEVTWEPEKHSHVLWATLGMLTGGAAFAYLSVRHPDLSLMERLLFAGPLPVLCWIADDLRILLKRMHAREALVQEQLSSVEARHEELRHVYLEQEQKTVELRQANYQIESLNAGLEEKVRKRTAELEDANERLKEMDRLKSQFLAHVSHELRTPLTGIKGLTENLLDGLGGPLTQKQEHNLRRVVDNAGRLARMITHLLERSRIEAGKIELTMREVDLAALIHDLVEQLRPLALARCQQLEFHRQVSVGAVWADPDKVNQILTNLIENALKYTQDGGRIVVAVDSRLPHWAEVSVQDDGPGIPTDALPKLFDPFYRMPHLRQGAPKGLGLGLSIVKQLVEMHGGTVSIRSEVGRGSEFRVTLPIRPTAGAAPAAPAGRTRRILVVDDDPDIRHLLQERLSAYGYHVDTAADGVDALRCLGATTFDGMILDISMPEPDGLAVLRQIRERSTLPIIMVTASGSKDRAVQAVSIGAQDYVLKPFDAGQLREVVERWFGAEQPVGP